MGLVYIKAFVFPTLQHGKDLEDDPPAVSSEVQKSFAWILYLFHTWFLMCFADDPALVTGWTILKWEVSISRPWIGTLGIWRKAG